MNRDSYLLYGETGSGKTSQLSEIARWLWESLGWRTRLVTGDSGDGPFGNLTDPGGPVESLDLAQVVMHTKYSPMTILNALADSYWPKQDPNSGAYTFTKFVDPTVQCYMFEGFQAFADLVMQDHVNTGRQIAEDVVGKTPLTMPVIGPDGKELALNFSTGQPGRAHYNHVQRYLAADWLPRTRALPVKLTFFTSHESDGKDDTTDAPILGPALIGQKGVGSLPQKFQDCIHLVRDIVVNPQTKKSTMTYRAWFQKHPQLGPGGSITTKMWPAKLSYPIPEMAKLLAVYPDSHVVLDASKGVSLVELVKPRLQRELQAKAKGTAENQERK